MIDLGESLQSRPQARVASIRRLFPVGQATLDIVLIYAAFMIAYWLRYQLKFGPAISEQVSIAEYQPIALLLLGIMMPALLVKGAYRTRLNTDFLDDFGTILSASTITIASIVVITAMLHKWVYSRGVILYLWVILTLILVLGRTAYRSLQTLCYRNGWGTRRLLVVGASDAAKMVMQHVVSRPDMGYRLEGFVEHRESVGLRDFGRFRALGTVSDIPDLIDDHQIDEVIVALPASNHAEVWSLLHMCERRGVGLKLVPDLFETSLSRVHVDDIAGIPLFDVQEKPLRRMARSTKRAIDIVVSAVLILVSVPLLATLALLIRLESRGTPVLWQDRVGLDGRVFRCLKLRTMRPGAAALQTHLQARNEAQGPIFKIKDDPRLTRVGRWLRRWSLDELPQIFNVLRGDMSLVGPRPPLPIEVAQYDEIQMRRLEVKPGMTGIWQVSGRSNLSFDEMVTMDVYYVENWSLALDVRILIRTVIAVLRRHGAY